MRARLAFVIASLVSPTVSLARPAPDPLRPPADPQPKPPSSAQRAAARVHYARALKLYQHKKLEAAAKELRVAIKLAPDPDLHYALARIEVDLDRCEDAITELQKYLETPHGPNATKAANDALDTCKARLAPPPPPPPAPPPPPPPPPAPKPAPVHHWYGDKLGDGLVLTGVASGVAALLLYRSAVSDLDAADASMTLADHARLVDDAHHTRTYALVAAGTGLAFVTAGMIRYLTHDRRAEPHGGVAVIPVAGGGMISFSGSLP